MRNNYACGLILVHIAGKTLLHGLSNCRLQSIFAELFNWDTNRGRLIVGGFNRLQAAELKSTRSSMD
jgi:hypothetical protein